MQRPVEVPQLPPPPGSPSSMVPSQSSSSPLQSSAVGPVSPVQTSAPPMHCSRPWSQVPVPVPQSRPPSGLPSSVMPSQSSSSPLQSSVVGLVAPMHVIAPLVQASVPVVHSPTLLPHAPPPPGSPSSTVPSQSSSRPSQISSGGVDAVHAYSQPLSSTPSRSVKPMSQLATVQVPMSQPAVAWAKRQLRPQTPQFSGSVSKATSSSTTPSQSLSRRSQIASSVSLARQRYSQPLSGSMSRSCQPTSQLAIPHMASTHSPNACGGAQPMPHPPQWLMSVVRSKSSSMSSSQSSSNSLQVSIASGTQASGRSKPASVPESTVASIGAASMGSPASPASTISSPQVRQKGSTSQPLAKRSAATAAAAAAPFPRPLLPRRRRRRRKTAPRRRSASHPPEELEPPPVARHMQPPAASTRSSGSSGRPASKPPPLSTRPGPASGSAVGSGTHSPISQISSSGQRSVSQGSATHSPLSGSHSVPIGQLTSTQRSGAHIPVDGSQTSSAPQLTSTHGSGAQTPPVQISPSSHSTSAQLRSQTPSRHASPSAHITPSQGSASQSPVLALQISPPGQPRPRQLSSTQTPRGSFGSQTVPSMQTTPSQGKVHSLFLQTQLVTPSASGAQSTVPSRSSVSMPQVASLQRSATQKQRSPSMKGVRPVGQVKPNSLGMQSSAH